MRIKQYNPDLDAIEYWIPIGPWGHMVYSHEVGAWRELASILRDTGHTIWPMLRAPIIALILAGIYQLIAKYTPLPQIK